MVTYYDAMMGLASNVLRAMAIALGVDENYFADKFDRQASVCRMIRYPAVTQTPLPGQLRAGTHTDYGIMTFVRGDDTPGGLQVKHRNGELDRLPHPAQPVRLQHRRPDDALVERPLGVDAASRRRCRRRTPCRRIAFRWCSSPIPIRTPRCAASRPA